MSFFFLFLIIRRPPIFTLFPYTTLFRSKNIDDYYVCRLYSVEKMTDEEEPVRVNLEGSQNFDRQVLKITYTLKDRKSTRLNSSHVAISYAVFCLKKKKKH